MNLIRHTIVLLALALGAGAATAATDDESQRPGDAANDQARTATPAEAIHAGSTHLVIGRSISRSPDPAKAFAAICDQVVQATAERTHDPAAAS